MNALNIENDVNAFHKKRSVAFSLFPFISPIYGQVSTRLHSPKSVSQYHRKANVKPSCYDRRHIDKDMAHERVPRRITVPRRVPGTLTMSPSWYVAPHNFYGPYKYDRRHDIHMQDHGQNNS